VGTRLRRKVATDLKHDTPLAELCNLGGWRDHNRILRCYMKPDEGTISVALAKRAERRATAVAKKRRPDALGQSDQPKTGYEPDSYENTLIDHGAQ
jgi:hypothetical protein